MSLVVTCGNGHRIQVGPQHQGKRVRCPMCQTPVDVPPAGEPPPAPGFDFAGAPPAPQGAWGNDPYQQPGPRYEERPMEPPTDAELDQLETVALGLGFMTWRYLFFVFGLFFATGATVLLLLETFRTSPPTSTFPQVLFGILMLLGVTMFFTSVVLGFIGSGMCAKAPARVGGGGIFTSLILDGLFVLLALTSVALAMIASINTPSMGRFAPPPDKTLTTIRWIVLIVLYLVMLVSQLLCHLYLKNLRRFLQERAAVILNMILWLSALGGGALVIGLEVLIMNMADAFPPTIFRVVFFTLTPFLLFALVVNVLLVFLIRRLRRKAHSLLEAH